MERNTLWMTYPYLHEKYRSPVVRVGPDHVHIKDIDTYEKIFRNGTNFYKDHTFYTCADNDGSIFSLCDRDAHRARRKALSPRFSKQAAEADAPGILQQLRRMEAFIVRQSDEGKDCNINDLFRTFAINIVGKTLLGDCGDLVTYEDSKPELLDIVDGMSMMIPTLRFFPYLAAINSVVPSFISNLLVPAGVLNFKKICEDYTRSRMDKPIRSDIERSSASVIELLVAHSHDITGGPPNLDYLAAEAFTFIDAGVDTAGRTLAAAVYHILRDPIIEKKLRDELDKSDAWTSGALEVDVRKLWNLPYLNAIIKEAHRIWPALPGPLPRVVPPEGLQVDSYFIPGGTIVSATHHSLHFDEDIFPEPNRFNPERWLRNDRTDLDRYLNPYSRGSRACIGINLAQAELLLAVADMFRLLDLELCEPIPSGLTWKDHFVAEPISPILIRARPREVSF
ncbi:cytochrome P450 [Aspergillus clavatus NRRL 1]|uniref:Benzoate 4-monooxygenase cytochrome P450 n=1 Tax=Aspergillus clavatus (strain ATCC 1007 / CBS 513.65 / DSM 816 / NCTC 3887 / NRRL 1 / QM 1276 / 107) TaxID=344612 RepID=A1C4G4_ASPCL|nr:benzoate 4-monooxygenase cytochrome P450 [Aspergillus clavatus NRRL 1]EAW15304.1 benzoate 4-monooxygenase cytochrome P450 [Aspergillus clavatus NRRL 1]